MTDPHSELASQPARTEAPQRVGVAERSHEWVREMLGDVLDGSLSADDRRMLEEHVNWCAGCAAFRRTLARTVEIARSLPAVKSPRDIKRRILDSLP